MRRKRGPRLAKLIGLAARKTLASKKYTSPQPYAGIAPLRALQDGSRSSRRPARVGVQQQRGLQRWAALCEP